MSRDLDGFEIVKVYLKFLKIESLVKILFAPAINFDFNLLFRTEPLKNLLSHAGECVLVA